MNQLVNFTAEQQLSALIAAAGERAAYRFLDFFTAQIRGPVMRHAFARNVGNPLGLRRSQTNTVSLAGSGAS